MKISIFKWKKMEKNPFWWIFDGFYRIFHKTVIGTLKDAKQSCYDVQNWSETNAYLKKMDLNRFLSIFHPSKSIPFQHGLLGKLIGLNDVWVALDLIWNNIDQEYVRNLRPVFYWLERLINLYSQLKNADSNPVKVWETTSNMWTHCELDLELNSS